MSQADIGLIGLAVMGQNLALNIDEKGYKVVVYNRTPSKVDQFLAGNAKSSRILASHSIEEFVQQLKTPRRIIMMVKAGEAVDQLIMQLLPHLEEGDVLIDGGNALYTDSNRRTRQLSEQGILFIGTGISGGEEGARHGPSMMPGGNVLAWSKVETIFQSIAAQVEGEPCCQWMGRDGAGHYVKMVHNGIEYGDMLLITEAYHLLKQGLQCSNQELAEIFQQWNQGVLQSYLIEITADIFTVMDEDGQPLVEKILDKAGQKGTGRWTAINALEQGIPLSLITEAVFARQLSALYQDRQIMAGIFNTTTASEFTGDKTAMIQAIHDALYASKIISYTQGFLLLQSASEQYQWDLDYATIAKIWRGGCIIRSQFLDQIYQGFEQPPKLANLLRVDYFQQAIKQSEAGWRNACCFGIEQGIPLAGFHAALSFFDAYRCQRLPANLLQAQRDYFGAHTYERIDKPSGEFFHTDWMTK